MDIMLMKIVMILIPKQIPGQQKYPMMVWITIVIPILQTMISMEMVMLWLLTAMTTMPASTRGVAEIAYNGLDDDCNAATPDDDLDGDGYVIANDCNDNNAGINPGITEIVYNGIDDDCNPTTLDDDLDRDGFSKANDCNDNNPAVNPGVLEIVYNGIDDDCNPQHWMMILQRWIQ